MRITILFTILFLIFGCRPTSHFTPNFDEPILTQKEKVDFDKMENCRKNWTYHLQSKEIKLKVLLFQKESRHSVLYYPNFIIGVTSENDTIGAIDTDYKRSIKLHRIITFSPSPMPEPDSNSPKPIFTIYPDSTNNNLFCKVKKVYYGRIK